MVYSRVQDWSGDARGPSTVPLVDLTYDLHILTCNLIPTVN
jgi:hypothetical protein